jgi:hypothetical protein
MIDFEKKRQELAEILTEIDRDEMAELGRVEESTNYTAEDLKDSEKELLIIEWLVNKIY